MSGRGGLREGAGRPKTAPDPVYHTLTPLSKQMVAARLNHISGPALNLIAEKVGKGDVESARWVIEHIIGRPPQVIQGDKENPLLPPTLLVSLSLEEVHALVAQLRQKALTVVVEGTAKEIEDA